MQLFLFKKVQKSEKLRKESIYKIKTKTVIYPLMNFCIIRPVDSITYYLSNRYIIFLINKPLGEDENVLRL